jgi:hypothetical protein
MHLVLIAVLAQASNISIPSKSEPVETRAEVQASAALSIVVADDASELERAQLTDFMRAVGQQFPVVTASDFRAGDPGIYVGEPDRHVGLVSRRVRHAYDGLKETGPQGYRLVIDRKSTYVVGGGPAGTYNGMQTLARIVRGQDSWPETKLRDEPDLAMRAVQTSGRPSLDRIEFLARQRCNMLLVDSPDFGDIQRANTGEWQRTFDAARRVGVALVPIIDPKQTSRRALGDLIAQLKPAYLHIGAARSEAAAMKPIVSAVQEVIKNTQTQTKLMVWVYPVASDAGRARLASALREAVPRNALLALSPRTAPGGLSDAARASWLRSLGRPYLAGVPADRMTVYDWCERLQPREGDSVPRGLLIVEGAGKDAEEAVRLGLAKSWRAAGPGNAWAEGLNVFFGVDHWEPDYRDMVSAMAQRVNRQTLAGVAPKEEAELFKETVRALKRRDVELPVVEQLYGHILNYVALEAEFSAKQNGGTLNALAKLVEEEAEVRPDADPARTQVIVETVKGKGLFAPSTVVFGEVLLPYRAMRVPRGHALLPLDHAPAYTDNENKAVASFELPATPGPIYRVDFETVGTAELRLESRQSDGSYGLSGKLATEERGGVRGPLLLQKPTAAPNLRVVAHAPAETAVLRNVYLAALKAPLGVLCPASRRSPELDGAMQGDAWPEEVQVEGFVESRLQRFSEAQTRVKLCYTKDALYVGVQAFEPRMDTLSAKLTARDAPLWEEEAFELWLDTGGGDVYRFLVNPEGAQYDAKNGDGAWNSDWRAAARKHKGGWIAELAIPFEALGKRPRQGEAWRGDFVRYRYNVKKGRSVWSYQVRDGKPSTDFGSIIFN